MGRFMSSLLSLQQLHISIDDKEIVNGVSLEIPRGSVHAIMGPNGSGKSTLSSTIMGHPAYTLTSGTLLFNGNDITHSAPNERAKAGIFLAFQYPYEIEGVVFKDFLRQSYNALHGGTEKQLSLSQFRALLEEKMALLGVTEEFITRHLNVGFSGGEKKRAEMLQMAVLQPQLVILDEIDSGLDVDALRTVCQLLNTVKASQPDMSILLITHYQRILNYITPDAVHIMQKGVITQSGGAELAQKIENTGYGQ